MSWRGKHQDALEEELCDKPANLLKLFCRCVVVVFADESAALGDELLLSDCFKLPTSKIFVLRFIMTFPALVTNCVVDSKLLHWWWRYLNFLQQPLSSHLVRTRICRLY